MNRDALKREEERKRGAAYDPVARWQHIQQTITWAEANLSPHLRRNRPRQPKPQREHGIKADSEAFAAGDHLDGTRDHQAPREGQSEGPGQQALCGRQDEAQAELK